MAEGAQGDLAGEDTVPNSSSPFVCAEPADSGDSP